VTPAAKPPAHPLLTAEQATELLDQVIYERLAELVDFDAIWRLEQTIAMALSELLSEDETIAKSKLLIDRAWHALADDPRRYLDVGSAPFDDCDLCEAEARHHARKRSVA
jgi:hypothetical protein